ncbi:MAG TPA: prepilin peptidase, partial [Paracoccaceae bacterium]
MLTSTAALWFLPFTLPVSLWVAWSDMKFMKIPNKAVMATALVYLAVGLGLVALAVLPLALWLWGWALLAIVLAVGFLMSTAGMIGAGDAKFAAVMAPFFVGSNILFVLALFAACLVAAFASHRLLKHT